MKISGWEYVFKKNNIKILPKSPIERPTHFYKYYSITVYNIEAIINSKFYFSHPLVFNDLFDASIQMIDLNEIPEIELVKLYNKYKEIIWVNEQKDYHFIKTYINQELKKEKASFLRNALTFYWNIIFMKTGLLSLASVDNNILLWSYYTNHEGISIEFTDLPIDNHETFGPFPINYTDKYKTLYPKKAEINNEHLLYTTNIKSTDWKHENEWRVLLRKDNLSIPDYPSKMDLDKNRLISYPKNIVSSVILGFKFFKGFSPSEVNRRSYTYIADNEHLNQKVELLNYLVDTKISVKQIQTNEDNTFCIEAAKIEIEIVERNKVYKVTRSRENKRSNIRLSGK